MSTAPCSVFLRQCPNVFEYLKPLPFPDLRRRIGTKLLFQLLLPLIVSRIEPDLCDWWRFFTATSTGPPQVCQRLCRTRCGRCKNEVIRRSQFSRKRARVSHGPPPALFLARRIEMCIPTYAMLAMLTVEPSATFSFSSNLIRLSFKNASRFVVATERPAFSETRHDLAWRGNARAHNYSGQTSRTADPFRLALFLLTTRVDSARSAYLWNLLQHAGGALAAAVRRDGFSLGKKLHDQ